MGSWHVLPLLRELFALRWNLAEATVIALGVFLASLFLLGLRLRDTMAVPTAEAKDLPNSGIKKLRKVSESEVIAEFLKNEFYQSDFDEVRAEFASLVLHPKLDDAVENARRRQLLFRKRAGMWRELPADTEWWEVEIHRKAFGRIRVFPRADWRHFAQTGFSLPRIAERIHAAAVLAGDNDFARAIVSMSQQLANGNRSLGSVLLIGLDEESALTIIEGNHRMVAAALAPTPGLQAFRFFCGLSPLMWKCCWYRASMGNLVHYAANLLKDLGQIRHSDVARVLPRRRLAARAATALTTPATALELPKTKQS